jgi:hypothetical protein
MLCVRLLPVTTASWSRSEYNGTSSFSHEAPEVCSPGKPTRSPDHIEEEYWLPVQRSLCNIYEYIREVHLKPCNFIAILHSHISFQPIIRVAPPEINIRPASHAWTIVDFSAMHARTPCKTGWWILWSHPLFLA